jgi:hypothetical protein
MSTNEPTNQRASQRFAVRNVDEIYATVSREDGAEVTAEPIDISEGGVKLRVYEPFRFDEVIHFVLGCAEGPMRLRISCRVAWLKEWEGCWLLGCQFDPKLPAEMLEELFSSGIVERRQFARWPAEGEATARWELQPEPFAAQLYDISEGGFCFRSSTPGQIEKRVRLMFETPDGPVTVQGKGQWFASVHDAYLVGCAFIDNASSLALRNVLKSTAGHST